MTGSPPSIAPATSPVGCVEGGGARDKDGYVKAFYQGAHTRAHRVAYCQAHGLSLEDIKGQLVLHSCDNPPCCNPEHLRLGTHSDNMQDRAKRGRAPKTAEHSRKVADDMASAIRNEYRPSVGNKPNPNGYAGLGRRYNLAPQAIKQIVQGKTYHTTLKDYQ